MIEPEAQNDSTGPQERPAELPAPDRTLVRERILRRFEVWLDEILDGEPPVEGLAAEILEQLDVEDATSEAGEPAEASDLHALWSAVTAMTEETRLQGRAFKQLREGLVPMEELVGSLGGTLERYEGALQRQEQAIDERAKQTAWKEILETLIDMRDRLIRGAESAEAWLERRRAAPERESGLAARIRGRLFASPDRLEPRRYDEAVQSLLTGYRLCQEVLDEALAEIGVRPMEVRDRPFDPTTMKAVDIDRESDAPDGTVLEVYRQGYWWSESVYRPTEVKVARSGQEIQSNAPGAIPDQGGTHESQ